MALSEERKKELKKELEKEKKKVGKKGIFKELRLERLGKKLKGKKMGDLTKAEQEALRGGG